MAKGTSAKPAVKSRASETVTDELAFSVDSKNRVRSWSRELEVATGRQLKDVLGKTYYSVLPRISRNGADPVASVFKTRRNLSLKGYRFGCPFGEATADVTISAGGNGSAEAVVELKNIHRCATSRLLRDSRPLINIGKTASSLAHGVRNPLNAIKGSVVYLSERYASEPALVEFTKIMQEEISRLDQFISRFLSASHNGDLQETVDLKKILGKLKVVTSLQMRARRIRSEFLVTSAPLPVSGDAFHLEQAFANVINNAIEAIGKKGTLRVKASVKTSAGKRCALVQIRDSGPGMMAAPKEGALPEGREGRGFGLFLARETLRSCGGRIEISSKQGKGTIVSIYLPLAAELRG